jgi:hypothetical protein
MWPQDYTPLSQNEKVLEVFVSYPHLKNLKNLTANRNLTAGTVNTVPPFGTRGQDNMVMDRKVLGELLTSKDGWWIGGSIS